MLVLLEKKINIAMLEDEFEDPRLRDQTKYPVKKAHRKSSECLS